MPRVWLRKTSGRSHGSCHGRLGAICTEMCTQSRSQITAAVSATDSVCGLGTRLPVLLGVTPPELASLAWPHPFPQELERERVW